MKEIIKINFSDFWPGFVKEDNYFYNLLAKKYDVKISQNPEILFYSCYGNNYLNFNLAYDHTLFALTGDAISENSIKIDSFNIYFFKNPIENFESIKPFLLFFKLLSLAIKS